MSEPTEREVRLQQMLTAAEQQNEYLVAAVQRVEGLSRLVRHNSVRYAGDHIADMIDRALSGA